LFLDRLPYPIRNEEKAFTFQGSVVFRTALNALLPVVVSEILQMQMAPRKRDCVDLLTPGPAKAKLTLPSGSPRFAAGWSKGPAASQVAFHKRFLALRELDSAKNAPGDGTI